MSQPPHSQIPGSEVKKKGMPALAWVGIGCGGIILIGIIVAAVFIFWGVKAVGRMASNPGKAAAEMMLKVNPDIEKVSENEATGEVTIRVKKTGEQVTLKYDELASGRITVKDADGKVTQLGGGDLSKVPAWVPHYPGATEEVAVFQSESTGGDSSGMFTAKSNDSSEVVEKFFELEAAKLSLGSSSRNSMTMNGTGSTTLSYSEGKRMLTINLFGKSGEPLTIQTTYSEKK